MSGFGTCPKCNRKGFTRRGASACTRCEKAAPVAVAVVETVETVAIATPCGVVNMPVDGSPVHTDGSPATPEPALPRKRYRRKNYIRRYGRILIVDDEE